MERKLFILRWQGHDDQGRGASRTYLSHEHFYPSREYLQKAGKDDC